MATAPAPQSAPAPHRPNRGLWVVVVLGVIFLALLALILISTGKRDAAPPTVSESLSVMPLRLRIRTEPNAKAPVVATATAGEKLIVLEDRGTWVRVQDSDGLAGWAERNSLERTSERDRRLARYAQIKKLPMLVGMVTSRATLYAGPGIFYPIAGDLPAETQVKIYTRDHDFYAIDHDNGIAYVDVDAVDVSAAGTKQLDVASNTPPAATPSTDTSATAAPPLTESTPVPTPAPAPPPSEPPSSPERGGAYAAVPPGGTQPEEVDRVVPQYPGAARRAGVAGPVVIRGIVRRDGTIDEVEIIKDLPYGLGDAARDAVRRWRFRPATYRGEPIDVYYTVTVNFRLQ